MHRVLKYVLFAMFMAAVCAMALHANLFTNAHFEPAYSRVLEDFGANAAAGIFLVTGLLVLIVNRRIKRSIPSWFLIINAIGIGAFIAVLTQSGMLLPTALWALMTGSPSQMIKPLNMLGAAIVIWSAAMGVCAVTYTKIFR